MDLLSYQRAFMRMSFAAEPAREDLAAVGSAEAALLYRHMIRTRLLGMAKVAFEGCLSLLGEEAFGAAFARYLAEAPPHSGLIRDVIADFAAFARGDGALQTNAAVVVSDLFCFEEAKWRLAYLPAPSSSGGEARELTFVAAPLWNPLFRILSLRHPVHTWASEPGARADLGPSTAWSVAEPCELFIYRPKQSDEVRWYRADPFFAALVRAAQASPERGFGELIPGVAAECNVAVDQELLESLATSLTLALERGVLLGVLDRS